MGDIVSFNSSVPAHISSMFGSDNTDLSNGVTPGGYAIISYKGNRWHVVEGGERTLVTNEDGDPRSSLEVVILKANPNLSKIYYEGGYTEGSSEKPTCYSDDGVGPAYNAVSPQSDKCAVCPHNAWGSRITENGSKGKACADLRRLAVAPSGDLTKPMLLRVPAASLKGLTQYANMLNGRKAPYSAVLTKVGFDPEVAYQRMKFSPVRWLTADELEEVTQTVSDDIIGRIIGVDSAVVTVNNAAPAPVDTLPPTPDYVQEPAKKAAPKVEEVAEFEEEEAAPPPKKPRANVKKIMEEVDASLDDVLNMLDD